MDSALNLQTLAIKAARENNWEEAIRLNKSIVDENEQDTSALNRLGFCYLQTNALKKAKTAYQRVIDIDKYNTIAKKYLDVIAVNGTQSDEHTVSIPTTMFQENFIDEPGKTKTVQLCRVADPSALTRTAIGTPCTLLVKMHRIAVETENGVYLGSLPDDLSHNLSRLLNAGNTYKIVVKSVTKNSVTVFIKELSRCKKFAYTTSFPNGTHAHSESHEELLIEQPAMEIENAEDDDTNTDEPVTRDVDEERERD